MIIKKFQANSETEAIMLAKEELGKDAIVMNIKTISPKGIFRLFRKSTVEVTAAIDEANNLTEKSSLGEAASSLNSGFAQELRERRLAVQGVKTEIADPKSIEERLNSLQALLESQLISKGKPEEKKEEKSEKSDQIEEKNISCVRLIYNQLVSNGVDEKYANQVIGEIEPTLKKDSSVDVILASFYQKIILKLGQPRELEVKEGSTKFVFFIGPTGVGKTTTIAKLASSFIVGKKGKVALLTSDTYRIAAVEQLRTYANILDIPMRVIYSETEMAEARQEYQDYDIVLVDTAGRSHKNKEQRDDLEKLIRTIPEEEREIYLVLSATTKYNDLIRITETYSNITDYRLIFTKLDETSTIGNIFNIKMLTNADLSYTTFGQDVPDDITKVNTQNIARKLLGGNE
ncbi:MAG: flagellar biosynthesis protein FlhF [Clostridiales bacterium]|nr:flagellar biosynthesis protein FlhF [Clostridiales bacterium]